MNASAIRKRTMIALRAMLYTLPTFYWFVRGRLNARVNDPAATGVALATSNG